MRDACASKVSMETMIFTTPVGLHSKNFSVKDMLNMSLEKINYFLNIRFVLKKIDPTMAAVVIHETNIIFVSTREGQGRTPDISVDKFKRCSRNTMRMTIR
jgi:hypothetical protein